jgi:hypothetical protein
MIFSLEFCTVGIFLFLIGVSILRLGRIVFSRFSLGAMGKFSLAVGYGFITVGVLIAVGLFARPVGVWAVFFYSGF